MNDKTNDQRLRQSVDARQLLDNFDEVIDRRLPLHSAAVRIDLSIEYLITRVKESQPFIPLNL